jgi:uncharacterized protein YjiS (DUF1127 family)
MTSERIDHWIKMRRSRARFSGSDLSIHTRSLANFITIMCEFRFSVHTGADNPKGIAQCQQMYRKVMFALLTLSLDLITDHRIQEKS